MVGSKAARVAVIGIHHQSNVFASETLARDFAPHLLRGVGLIDAAREADARLPSDLGAFLETTGRLELEPVPLFVAAADSGGTIRQDAFDDLVAEAEERLRAVLPVDGLVLSLTGALVTSKEEDPEGKLVERLHAIIGKQVPLLVMLESGGNPSDLLIAAADLVLATPDPTERGHQAATMMTRLLAGERYQTVLLRLPIVIPLASLSAEDGTYGKVARDAELAGTHEPIVHAAVLHGFVFNDRARAGVSVLVSAGSKQAAMEMSKHIAALVWSERSKLVPRTWRLDQAALFAAEACSRPGASQLVLADVADDPQGGGTSNITYLLEALQQRGVTRTLLGPFVDPKLAEEAQYRQVGTQFIATFNRGGNIGYIRRLQLDAVVVGLSDGKGTGMWGRWAGRPVDFGPSAALDLGGITVAVTTRRQPVADAALFGLLGLDAGQARVLAIKGSGLVRSGFGGLVPPDNMIEVDGPGLTSADVTRQHFKNLAASKYPFNREAVWGR